MAKPKIEKYGLKFPADTTDLEIEMYCIERGGQWKKKTDGTLAGMGMLHHWRKFQEIVWPDKEWHKWSELQLECYLKYTYIAELGPASAGKTYNIATNLLTEYFCFPYETTVLLTTDTLEGAEQKVWGTMKKLFNEAIARHPDLPGRIITGRRRIVSDDSLNDRDGADFRNGVVVVPAKKGTATVGLGAFVGVKSKRVRLAGDELHLLPKTFVDSFSNLNKNPDFKAWGGGNPKDTTDALGFIAEPANDLGGWESGIDQRPGTKTWRTRMPNGICIHLPGSDSPNNDYPDDAPRWQVIGRAKMKADAQIWSVNDWHYLMMDEGRMPRGMGSRRVLTRQMAMAHHAMDDPKWKDHRRTYVASLDAAYRGVGGDRCIFSVLCFGQEAPTDLATSIIADRLLSQDTPSSKSKNILALMYQKDIPIETTIQSGPGMMSEAEEQIVNFCKTECETLHIPPAYFYFDSGMRTGLVTAFGRLWSPEVNSVDCGGKPSEEIVGHGIDIQADKYFSKRITQLWWNIRFIVEASQFRGLTEEPLNEFCQREWKQVSGNRIEIESKPEFKQKLGLSPDASDSLTIGIFGAVKSGFTIANAEVIDLPDDYNPGWKRKVVENGMKRWNAGALSFK